MLQGRGSASTMWGRTIAYCEGRRLVSLARALESIQYAPNQKQGEGIATYLFASLTAGRARHKCRFEVERWPRGAGTVDLLCHANNKKYKQQ